MEYPDNAAGSAFFRDSHLLRLFRHEAHAYSHSFAMGKGGVVEIPFHRMAYGVSEVQNLPFSRIKFIFLHHLCFLEYAVEDDFFYMPVQVFFCFQGFKDFKKLPVPDASVLHRFRQAVMDIAGRQGLQEIRIDKDTLRLVKGTGQVLPPGRSTATLPPTELSIWARMVVGIWKKESPSYK